ncbi:MAG: hypothetical protein AB7F64_07895 [Gammaproteobacteria bacterium]
MATHSYNQDRMTTRAIYHRFVISPYTTYGTTELLRLKTYSLMLINDFWIFESMKVLLEDVIKFRNQTDQGAFHEMRKRGWKKLDYEKVLIDAHKSYKLIINYLNGLKALKNEKQISDEDILELELTINFCKNSLLERIQMLQDINDEFFVHYKNLNLKWEDL